MKAKERMQLLENIGLELQSLYTFAELDIYLKSKQIDVTRPTSGANSKRIYAKELLSTYDEDVLLDIAEDLDLIPYGSSVAMGGAQKLAPTPTFWIPGHFKLFISHLTSFKKETGALREILRSYGISGFVAHDDIKPTAEWQSEIEAALHSMDAFVAILQKGFKESQWCDQEIGFAIARNVFLIPLVRDLNPYGFIAKVQGLKVSGKPATEVARAVYDVLLDSPRTHEKLVACVVTSLMQSSNSSDAIFKIGLLENISSVPSPLLEQLRQAASSSLVLSTGQPLARLNELLRKNGVAVVGRAQKNSIDIDDDIPF